MKFLEKKKWRLNLLIPKAAWERMQELAKVLGTSAANLLRIALWLLDRVVHVLAAGGRVLLVHKDGSTETIGLHDLSEGEPRGDNVVDFPRLPPKK